MLGRFFAAPCCRLCMVVQVAVFTLLLSRQTAGFQFYLHAGEKRCFTESATPSTRILGEYTVSTGRGHMPVDIVVRMEGQRNTLYSRQNADHGKFAFIVPYDAAELPRVKQAELHRKLNAHMSKMHHEMQQQHAHFGVHHGEHVHEPPRAHQRRRLLSVDEHDHGHDYGSHDQHHAHQAHHGHHGAHRDHHGHGKEDDEDDYDYEDDLDDFDADDYDGIEDDELEQEIEKNERQEMKLHGRFEDAPDDEKEDRLFDVKKFEICVFNGGDRTGFKRRVRLVVNKGEMAHDYIRLAKKEHLTQLEVSLRQVSGELHELMNELDRARQMEDVLRQLNENTNKRVVVFAIISLFSLFAVGGYQAFYTKRFFKQKKIL